MFRILVYLFSLMAVEKPRTRLRTTMTMSTYGVIKWNIIRNKYATHDTILPRTAWCGPSGSRRDV